MKIFYFLFLPAFVGFCHAACPDISVLSNFAFCAIMYRNDGCDGQYYYISNNERAYNLKDLKFFDPAFEGAEFGVYRNWNDRVSSLQVKPGCVLMVFENKNFEKDARNFTYQENGILSLRNWHFNDKISSFQCYCDSWTECQPKDEKVDVAHFKVDKNAKEPVTYTYEQSYGTEISQSQTSGSSDTTKLTAGVKATLATIFKLSMSLSHEWKSWQETTNTNIFQTETKFTAQVVVNPGETVVIKQRQATCGDFLVKGEFLEASDQVDNKKTRAARFPPPL